MEWINQSIWYSETILLVITLVFAAQWKKKIGQPLLVAALACILATHVFLQVRYWLVKAEVLTWRSPPGVGMAMVATAAGLAFNILLLLYVIRIFQEKTGNDGKENTAVTGSGTPSDTAGLPITVGRALFSFNGRMRRSDYWLKGFLPMLPFSVLGNILAYGVRTSEAMVFAVVIGIFSMWPGLALIVKRLHDRNHSGSYALMMLIPIVGPILIMVEVVFLRGTVGPNRFGDDPVRD
jgi:uncharacterized membrane protein YhaH (DUF805 family)